MTTITTTHDLLQDDLLADIAERSASYDRDNRFCHEDIEALRSCGYLTAAVPIDMGGAGLQLSEILQLQRRLAYAATPTAIAVNMHLYWTGVAADLLRAGDPSCRWILERAAAGEIFAAIHGEAGNDIPLLLSTTSATRVDGGWRISGHKIFGSLSPVWDCAGFHAMDTAHPSGPQIVHGFIRKSDPGVQIVETWDTLGMRASQSQDTILDNVFVPDERVVLVCPAGFAGAGMFQVTVFAWALLGFAAVYLGAAERAFDLTIERMPQRTSIALTRSMAHHPEVQHHVADMRVALDACRALLERTADDWTGGVGHADWPVRLVGTRHFVIGNSFEIVDRALDLSGGAGAFKRNRLEQLFRDVRMGRFHPGNTMFAHEVIGKLCLGIDPDDPQRWG